MIVASSGLVASMALPAYAVSVLPSGTTVALGQSASVISNSTIGAASVSTATLDSAPVGGAARIVDGVPVATGSAFLQAPASLSSGASVTAPAGAKLSFETTTVTALPKPKPKPKPKPVARPRAASATRASRSSSRTALSAPAHRSSRSSAKSSTTRSTGQRAASSSRAGSGVLSIASRYAGIYYRWGGTTPAGFDCSGFTGYVFRQLGIHLPRTADAQMRATRRVSASQARPGDLVFNVSGGQASHVGIYAGHGMMWDSPRTGRTVGLHAIWFSSAVYTRP